jgi:MoaE protein
VALVHRLGRLTVGETSVLVVVASAHRGAGFDACRWLIDTLKKTVPIWKKETFVDGEVWADGEAFPKEIGLPGRSEAKAQSASGEAFPEEIGLPGRSEAKAQSASGEAFPETLALGQVDELVKENGRPSDDAHTSEAMYRAPGFVGSGRLRSGK